MTYVVINKEKRHTAWLSHAYYNIIVLSACPAKRKHLFVAFCEYDGDIIARDVSHGVSDDT